MSLRFADPPSMQGLGTCLADGLHQIGRGIAAGTALDVLTPVPVYAISGAVPHAPHRVRWKKTDTWRALVLSEGEPVATLQFRAPFQPHLAGIRDADSARALYSAFEAAENFAATQPTDYELRFVAAPRMFVTAVWLTGARSVFIPTRTGKSTRSAVKLFDDADFAKLLRRRHRVFKPAH